MTDWLTFEGRVEPMEWGRSTYTVLRLPPDVEAALTGRRARRVDIEINDHPANLALTRAPVIDGVFLWTGKTLLDRAGIAPGEPVEVRLRPADDDRVDTPEDLAAALRAAGRSDAFARLTPGRRRGMIHGIDTARTAATRAKRIAALIAELPA